MRPRGETQPRNAFSENPSSFRIRARALLELAPGKLCVRRTLAMRLHFASTHDALANLDLLRPVCDGLENRATLRVIAEADHSFHVLKRSGKNDAEIVRELAQAVASWAEGVC